MKKITTDEFIKKAIEIHGEIYDYSKTKYTKAQMSVIVICPKHGEFNIKPNNHISGKQGCSKCGHKMHILSTDEFIEKAIQVHGENYDYSKTKYIKMGQLLIIICPIHGDFEQIPSNHITHCQGCKKCVDNTKSTTIEFIEKAIQVHGVKYNYSRVDYKNRSTHIEIICPEHGMFSQTPGNHLYGYGCSFCGIIKMATSQKKPLNVFIEEANVVHNNIYDYSNVIYENARTYITINCSKHGPFIQTPDSHLRGCGCPKCYTRHSKSQIEWLKFMESFKKIHIRHAENGGEYKIPNTKYFADGYCEETHMIFEYHGCFWHGNLKLYNIMDINPITKTTFGQLYEKTIKREKKIKERGYKLKIIWDSEWKQFKKSIIQLQRSFRKN